MIIKKKSLIVALVSSLVICVVLIVNLAGYLLYLQLKDDESNKSYRMELQKVNAKVYSKHIEIAKLGASFSRTGPLGGMPILEGIIRNDGYKDITDICIKVRFLDIDGAVLYEVVFHPQEPSLRSRGPLTQASASHISDSYLSSIKPESSLPFKKILANCPKEILSELKHNARPPKDKGRWSGRCDYEILSISF